MSKYLLIDIGQSSVKYAVSDEQRNLSSRGRRETLFLSTREEFYSAIEKIAEPFKTEISGISISMPGVIDAETGFCYKTNMIKGIMTPIAADLTEIIGVPVTVINDGYSAALAELNYGSMTDVRNGLVLVLGTGIGGGIIINHELYTGSHFRAGDFSFIYSDIDQPDDRDTMFAFTNGIPGVKKAILETCGLEDIDGLKAFQLMDEGNEDVRKGFVLFADRLAFHIYNLQTCFDVERIAIGGGLSNDSRTVEFIREAVDRRWQTAMVPINKPEICNCAFNRDSNLIGALCHFLKLTEKEG